MSNMDADLKLYEVHLKSNGPESDAGTINIPISDFGVAKHQDYSWVVGIMWPMDHFGAFMRVELRSNSQNFYGLKDQPKFPSSWVINPANEEPKYRFFGTLYVNNQPKVKSEKATVECVNPEWTVEIVKVTQYGR